MNDLTILHLSDLHWSKAKQNDQRIVVDALLTDLQKLKSEGVVPDLVIFSGDLVQAADEVGAFDSVKQHVIDRLVAATAPAPLIMCPGNHDIERNKVRASGGIIEAGMKAKFTSVDAVNKFIDELTSNAAGAAPILDRMEAYEHAAKQFNPSGLIRDTALLKTAKFDVRGLSVGVAAFNTAWRATGESESADRHQLLLGERNVDLAVDDLSDCDIRIATFHHPLDWLTDFDNVAVASRLYAEFDFLLYGHSHRSEPETKITPIGTSIISQSGCLYEHRDYFNGYQIIKIDTTQAKADFIIRTYFNRPRRTFDKAVNIAENGEFSMPYHGRRKDANAEVAAFLREARPIIRQAAAEQVNIVEAVSDLRLDPKEAFICPPLTMHRSSSISGDMSKKEDEISAEEILQSSDNYLLSGRRESGKSTLAHYLAVLCAEGACDRPRIPVVIDFRIMKINAYGLNRAIATYFGAAKLGLDIEVRLAAGDFLIIVDNFTGDVRQTKEAIAALIAKYPAVRWVLMGDSRLGVEVEEKDSDLLTNFRPVHIQALPRKSIRELSRRWCEQIGVDNQKAFTAVMTQLRDANLPRTGYMVTLLLWALYQEKKFERINEAVLLTSVVDHLLGKADFTQALHRVFDPTSKEITLQYLATVIHDENGVISKNSALKSLIDFFEKKGLQYDAAEVLQKLIDCGLLSDNSGLIAFKYRCFEEYFYAGMLRANPEALSDALKDRKFLGLTRELDLLSGLRRQNPDLIEVISSEIKAGAPKAINKISVDLFSEIAEEETGGGLTPRRLSDIQKKKLTAEQIDDLMDVADKRAAEIKENGDKRKPQSPKGDSDQDKLPAEINGHEGEHSKAMDPFSFMSSVDLLGRITRNSEFTDASVKEDAVRMHVNYSSRVMLLYMDILRSIIGTLGDMPDDERGNAPVLSGEEVTAARYILVKWFFLGVSAQVSDQIGTEKLFVAFEKVIDDDSVSLVERLILAMLMLDLGHPRWLAIWEKIVKQANGQRLVLDLLMDRLWRLLHTRPLNDNERKRVEAAAGRIDDAFGLPKSVKSDRMRSIRDTARETARQEGDPED